MRRKIRPVDPSELFDADDINRTSAKGEMRKLYPAIHQKLTEGGWSARDMVKWLDERGIGMSVELFRVYLNDLDKEHGYSRSNKACRTKEKATLPQRQPQSGSTVSKPAPGAPAAAVPATKSTKSGCGNPLRALSGNRKPGEFNPVPTAKIEIDTGDE